MADTATKEAPPKKDKETERTEKDKGNTGGTPNVTSLLDGAGEALFNVFKDRKVYELVILWLMTLATGGLAVWGLKQVKESFESDPNIKQLNHEQKLQTWETISEHFDEWFDRGQYGVKKLVEKLKWVHEKVHAKDIVWATAIHDNTTTMRQRIAEVRQDTRDISIIPGKKLFVKLGRAIASAYRAWRTRRAERKAEDAEREAQALQDPTGEVYQPDAIPDPRRPDWAARMVIAVLVTVVVVALYFILK